MRVYLGQIGCRLNYSEMETLAARLRAAGHAVVARPVDAQVMVFNTCAVTADAARGSRKEARALHAANPQAALALTGCWATLAPHEAAALPGVRLVAANAQKDLLPLLLEPWSAEYDDPALLARLHPLAPLEHYTTQGEERRARTRAFLKVQDGCNNRCTFCIVTVARGSSRSRPRADLVAEAQRLVGEGVQELVLTGVHLGSYGRDLNGSRANLRSLVESLLSETPARRLRLSSLEPWDLTDDFWELWARWPDRLCPHLHLPLQAGTDRQLRAMARRCTVATFRALVEAARATIPGLILTTDLIAGFPGETENDFAAGLEFVSEMRFAHAHVFPFSPRAGTAAASFADQVPGEVKRERAACLRAAVEATGAAERARFEGTVRPVLWEGVGQPLSDAPGSLLWSGLTDNNLRVLAAAPAGANMHNILTDVRLESLHGEVFSGVLY